MVGCASTGIQLAATSFASNKFASGDAFSLGAIFGVRIIARCICGYCASTYVRLLRRSQMGVTGQTRPSVRGFEGTLREPRDLDCGFMRCSDQSTDAGSCSWANAETSPLDVDRLTVPGGAPCASRATDASAERCSCSDDTKRDGESSDLVVAFDVPLVMTGGSKTCFGIDGGASADASPATSLIAVHCATCSCNVAFSRRNRSISFSRSRKR
jgi:hypothetical protein